jgi:peptide/nickel transport system permease protein/nickel transport system permease protein
LRQFLRKRLLGFAVVLIGVSILSFLLLAFSGKDPAEAAARRANIKASEEVIETVRVEMGLDKPLSTRYVNWVKGLVTGDLGISLYSTRAISKDLAEYFPVTFALVGMALLWIILLGVPLSLLCVRFRNGVVDQLTRGATMLGICIPTFWLGFLLLLAFAVEVPIFKVAPEPGIKGYILPSFALGFPVACGLVRLFRSTLLSQLSADYVRYAKARGLSPGRILVRHVMRNALPPIVTLFCQYLGYLIAGSAVVESVFSIKGIGLYLIACVMASDATSVATCIVIIAAIFVLANLAGDIINRLLCPWMVRESNA